MEARHAQSKIGAHLQAVCCTRSIPRRLTRHSEFPKTEASKAQLAGAQFQERKWRNGSNCDVRCGGGSHNRKTQAGYKYLWCVSQRLQSRPSVSCCLRPALLLSCHIRIPAGIDLDFSASSHFSLWILIT